MNIDNFYHLLNLQNWDLITVGVAIAAIIILAYIAYFTNPKSITNKSFLFFAFMTVLYGAFNYINYKVSSPFLILWFLRLTIFAAIWHAFSLFQFFYVFPKEQVNFSKIYTKILVPITIFVSLLTLTPLVFSKITQVVLNSNQVSNPEKGPAIALFGLMALFLVFGGIYNLIKKAIHVTNIEQKKTI